MVAQGEKKSATSYRRYVAIGDSFTEGVGDWVDFRPNGVRGWADRVAEQLSLLEPDFEYANLAVRGRKLGPVIEEQLEPALELNPDLVSIHAGGNDLLRPSADLDAIGATYQQAVARLRDSGASVVMFTTFDPGSSRIYGLLRGRMALFNEFVREIAENNSCTLVDMWRMRGYEPAQVFDADRMHLNLYGHTGIACSVLDALGVEHQLTWPDPPQVSPSSRMDQARTNAAWAQQHLLPWVGRRLTGRSSGDKIGPKQPRLAAVDWLTYID